jgi:hypothetical protein
MLEHETLIRLERSIVNCREKQIDPCSPSGQDVAARHFSASADLGAVDEETYGSGKVVSPRLSRHIRAFGRDRGKTILRNRLGHNQPPGSNSGLRGRWAIGYNILSLSPPRAF